MSRNRLTAQREEMMKTCEEYRAKIKYIIKENTSLKTAKRKITDILRLINYVPFSPSVDVDHRCPPNPGANGANPEPGKGLVHRSNFRSTKRISASHRQTTPPESLELPLQPSISISTCLQISILPKQR